MYKVVHHYYTQERRACESEEVEIFCPLRHKKTSRKRLVFSDFRRRAPSVFFRVSIAGYLDSPNYIFFSFLCKPKPCIKLGMFWGYFIGLIEEKRVGNE